MSKYVSLPLTGVLKRLVVSVDIIRITEDEEGKVFVTDDLGECYEVDMKLENLVKLFYSKSFIAKGRRKTKPNEPSKIIRINKCE